MDRAHWSDALSAAFSDFCRRVETGEELEIDDYASASPAEFFAVMSEAFFESPLTVRELYPEVYTQFACFYRQDPAARHVMRAPAPQPVT
jgi:Mlc titration factor MtfA (ptsG expression regulator)